MRICVCQLVCVLARTLGKHFIKYDERNMNEYYIKCNILKLLPIRIFCLF